MTNNQINNIIEISELLSDMKDRGATKDELEEVIHYLGLFIKNRDDKMEMTISFTYYKRKYQPK